MDFWSVFLRRVYLAMICVSIGVLVGGLLGVLTQ